MRSRFLAAALTAAALTAAACGDGSGGNGSGREARDSGRQAPVTTTTRPAVDPASVKANELGSVPVIMYHQLLPNPKGEYDRTPADFTAEIQRLYDSGYRPVLARELAAGTFDIPAGKFPVVLTFDDATTSQYGLTDGRVTPGTAVAVLLDFAKTHPDFRPVATMYVNRDPFGSANYAPYLKDLAQRGFEIGNHTANHVNLSRLDATGVQQEIVADQRVIRAALPDVKVETFAFPLGVRPKDPALALRGTWEGESYSHAGAFLVGAGPSPSPFSTSFKPEGIPRIRSAASDPAKANYGSSWWLDWYEAHPDRRYVSDGNPDRVSFPKAEQAKLNPALAGKAQPY